MTTAHNPGRSVDAIAIRVARRYLGVDPLAIPVARRFVAESIGNPQALLQAYDAALRHITDLDHLVPQMKEAEKIVRANGGFSEARHKAHLNALLPHENELLNNVYFKNIYKFGGRISLDGIKLVNPWSLFLALLQQYDLPPTTRKAVETASKYFAKSRIRSPKDPLEWVDAYEVFVKQLRAFSLVAHDALAHGKPRTPGAAEAAPEKFRAGPFTLVNTGGFNDAVLANCAKVVEVAAHQLQSHGLGKVCYGDVLISNTLMKSNVLAFYLLQKDEMFVRANLKGKEGAAVETVVHELGHRLMYKFLAGKHREIDTIYSTIARKSSAARSEAIIQVLKDPALKPKPGDTFVSKGEEYTVTGFDVTPRGGVIVQLVAKVQPQPGVTLRAKIPLEAYAAAKGILPHVQHSGFVTGYAKTDAAENFAEMVAYFCLGRLPPDQVEMLESVIR